MNAVHPSTSLGTRSKVYCIRQCKDSIILVPSEVEGCTIEMQKAKN